MTPSSIVPQADEEQTHSTMMAWRVHEFGPPKVMRFERVPRPKPGPGEILVKVEGAGVGPWDDWIRAGKSALPQPLPLILGSDLSGEIVATGPGVSELRVGEQVYGVTNPQFIGAYAEYALASATMVSSKPTSLTYNEAASVPVIAVTAWQALFDQAQLKAGQTVLIHGAAGNVGAYAVQLASRAGLRTIATAAADDVPFVRNLGADTPRLTTGHSASRRRFGMRTLSSIWWAARHRSVRFRSSVEAASWFRRYPILISILRKATASKPRSSWSTSRASIWRRSPASSMVES